MTDEDKHPGQDEGAEISAPVPSEGEAHCIIVGVGASAGGFEAFKDLLEALPSPCGLAFVFVQHLDPGHESMLPALLARCTKMPVAHVSDAVRVEPDNVYVAPPNSNVVVLDGTLTAQRIEQPLTRHKTIDFFFRSLAADQGLNSVGVLLSGTASDGVLGLKAIKAEGGIALVQDEKSARFDSMPRAAAQAGVADYILPPAAIAAELVRIKEHYPRLVRTVSPNEKRALDEAGSLHKILALVWTASNVDFSHYKPTTLKRRILRRMVLNRLSGIAEYQSYLENHPEEVQALYQDLVINVTSFFRDPEVFAGLQAEILPRILQNKPREAPLRIWVPGCSTGEEAYSLAIAVLEFLGERASAATIQIFGTDISDSAIERARAGIYPESIEAEVGPERLRRFFLKRDGSYQIAKAVRDMCIFARQNVFKDPPFSNLDLISCRNVLIYFGPELQKRVFPMFHYALNANGFLLLGSSESIGVFADYFALAHSKYKIYAKKSVSPQVMVNFSRADYPGMERQTLLRGPGDEPVRSLDPQREADRLILDKYAPPSVLVNGDMNILQFRGRTGSYLEPAPGAANFHLLRMAREGLTVALHAAIHEALSTLSPVRKENVRFKSNGAFKRVDVHVIPVPGSGGAREKFLLVLFENTRTDDEAQAEAQAAPAEPAPPTDGDELQRMRHELAVTKEYLQSVIESQEAFNEELRSANEEILSANEELQSTNEELETAKEELQSANEELTTLNEELQTRNQELAKVNDDLNNLLNSINLAIVMLDSGLRVRRFTPLAEKLMNLIPTDTGRPFSDINPGFDAPRLVETVREVVDTLGGRDLEVQDRDGHWYNLRIRPYRTMDNRIDGAMLALVDIESAKQSAEHARRSEEYADALAEVASEPLLTLDGQLAIVALNRAFCRRFEIGRDQVLTRKVYELPLPGFASPELRAALERIAGQPGGTAQWEQAMDDGGARAFAVRRLVGANDASAPCLVLCIREGHAG